MNRLPAVPLVFVSVLALVSCGDGDLSAPTAPSAGFTPAAAVGSEAAAPASTSSLAGTEAAEACTSATRITDVRINTNMASPRLEIEPVFDGDLAPFEVEVERLKNGQWLHWARKASDSGSRRVTVEVWFNQTYRIRVRVTGCAWGEWVEKIVGRSNPCGNCGDAVAGTGTITLGGSIN